MEKEKLMVILTVWLEELRVICGRLFKIGALQDANEATLDKVTHLCYDAFTGKGRFAIDHYLAKMCLNEATEFLAEESQLATQAAAVPPPTTHTSPVLLPSSVFYVNTPRMKHLGDVVIHKDAVLLFGLCNQGDSVDRGAIRDMMEALFGKVRRVRTWTRNGYTVATVVFMDPTSARKAIEASGTVEFDGRILTILQHQTICKLKSSALSGSPFISPSPVLSAHSPPSTSSSNVTAPSTQFPQPPAPILTRISSAPASCVTPAIISSPQQSTSRFTPYPSPITQLRSLPSSSTHSREYPTNASEDISATGSSCYYGMKLL